MGKMVIDHCFHLHLSAPASSLPESANSGHKLAGICKFENGDLSTHVHPPPPPSHHTIFSLLTPSTSISDTVAELLNLQSQSPNNVIHLNDNFLRRIVSSSKSPRTFFLIIFFDALQLHDKSELHLKELKYEFYLLAKSFISNNKDSPSLSKLFFCDIEFRESQATFAQFAVNALPHIRLVPPTAVDLLNSALRCRRR